MKKVILLLTTGLAAVILIAYNSFIDPSNYLTNILYNIFLILLSLFGMLFLTSLMRKWGGFRSKMGLALFFLFVSFFFNIIGTISHTLQNTQLYTYTFFDTIFFMCMYLSWGISLLYFFIVSGFKQKRLLIFTLSVLFILGLVVFLGSGIFKISFLLSLFDISYTFVDLYLLLLTALFLFHLRKLRGGSLFAPFVFFGLGILFQFFGDVMVTVGLNQTYGFGTGLINAAYLLSWFLLAFSPATFPEE